MADFLAKHRAEVTNVILSAYNAERHIKNEKEISYQDGGKDGIEEGRKEGKIEATIEILAE